MQREPPPPPTSTSPMHVLQHRERQLPGLFPFLSHYTLIETLDSPIRLETLFPHVNITVKVTVVANPDPFELHVQMYPVQIAKRDSSIRLENYFQVYLLTRAKPNPNSSTEDATIHHEKRYMYVIKPQPPKKIINNTINRKNCSRESQQHEVANAQEHQPSPGRPKQIGARNKKTPNPRPRTRSILELLKHARHRKCSRNVGKAGKSPRAQTPQVPTPVQQRAQTSRQVQVQDDPARRRRSTHYTGQPSPNRRNGFGHAIPARDQHSGPNCRRRRNRRCSHLSAGPTDSLCRGNRHDGPRRRNLPKRLEVPRQRQDHRRSEGGPWVSHKLLHVQVLERARTHHWRSRRQRPRLLRRDQPNPTGVQDPSYHVHDHGVRTGEHAPTRWGRLVSDA